MFQSNPHHLRCSLLKLQMKLGGHGGSFHKLPLLTCLIKTAVPPKQLCFCLMLQKERYCNLDEMLPGSTWAKL